MLCEQPNPSDPEYDPDKVRVKLTDFGFATFFAKDRKTLNYVLGSQRYMAPEIWRQERHSQKVDIWALGVLTYLMLSGRHVWDTRKVDELRRMVLQDDPDVSNIQERIGRPAGTFILKCLEKDPAERPTADELLRDNWFNDLRVSAFQDTEFNRAFINVYSYSKVDNFTTAISSIVAKMLVEPESEAVLRRIFESADHDKTGTLDEVKLHNAMSGIRAELHISQEDVSRVFRAINKRGDGQINFPEFLQASLDCDIIVKEDNLRKVFTFLAKNSSGISAQKLKQAFGSGSDVVIGDS